MKIIDLTHSLSESTIVYPGKTCFSRIIAANYEEGYCLHDVNMGTGIGTHMDAPAHFFKGGATIDKIPLTQCHGPACVLHLSEKVNGNAEYLITAEDILDWEKENGEIPKDSLLFAHTGWDKYWGEEKFCFQDEEGVCHYPGFSEDAAKLILQRGVSGLGIDTMSLDVGTSTEFPAHKTLLPNNIFLVENLKNLGELPSTGAKAWVLPMKIEDAPEAPVRAFALL